MFKAGQQIRCLVTGNLYLVIQKFKCAVMVSDLNSGEILNEPKLIVERDWDKFVPDTLAYSRKKKYNGYSWGQVTI
jgi:hypothetical protein